MVANRPLTCNAIACPVKARKALYTCGASGKKENSRCGTKGANTAPAILREKAGFFNASRVTVNV